MRVPKSRGGPVCEFDRTVTPMVDVLFQLLVFFVLASGGRVAEQSLSTVLSSGNVSSPVVLPNETKPAELWIHLTRDQKNQRTVARMEGRTFEEISGLEMALRRPAHATRESRVILDVEGEVPLGDVILAYDACRAARFHSINFAATPEELASAKQR